MNQDTKIYVAGHRGMVGSALMRKFAAGGFTNIITCTRMQLDLRNQFDVNKFFKEEQPEFVIIAAAKVGGILANNTFRAEFLYDNLMIQSNIIHAAYQFGAEKLIFLGSSCIYPRSCAQPIKEEYLLTGQLEQTNEPYAISKIAGIKLCENYFRQYGCNFYSVMPTNLYGPNDNFDLETSHVLPALIRKFYSVKNPPSASPLSKGGEKEGSFVSVWGTGTPRREFLYVDDLADAVHFLMKKVEAQDIYNQGITHLNIGTGEEITIKDLAFLIKKIVGFEGEIVFDKTKPDGTPRKLMDVTRIHELGWRHKIELEEGIRLAYNWFLQNYE
ncbi:MAG: GDP-L-fucose synthase [Bacteroidota bacterium]